MRATVRGTVCRYSGMDGDCLGSHCTTSGGLWTQRFNRPPSLAVCLGSLFVPCLRSGACQGAPGPPPYAHAVHLSRYVVWRYLPGQDFAVYDATVRRR